MKERKLAKLQKERERELEDVEMMKERKPENLQREGERRRGDMKLS